MSESQATRLLELLRDGRPHSTIEILEVVYGGSHFGIARVSARIYDLRKKGHLIEGKRDAERKTIYWYTLHLPVTAETK